MYLHNGELAEHIVGFHPVYSIRSPTDSVLQGFHVYVSPSLALHPLWWSRSYARWLPTQKMLFHCGCGGGIFDEGESASSPWTASFWCILKKNQEVRIPGSLHYILVLANKILSSAHMFHKAIRQPCFPFSSTFF